MLRFFVILSFVVACACGAAVPSVDVPSCDEVCDVVCDLAVDAVPCADLCAESSEDPVLMLICESGCNLARDVGAAECPEQCENLIRPIFCKDALDNLKLPE